MSEDHTYYGKESGGEQQQKESVSSSSREFGGIRYPRYLFRCNIVVAIVFVNAAELAFVKH